MVIPTFTYEMYLSGAWTDVTSDVLIGDTITMRRGLPGNHPHDCVAQAGTFQFSLNNGPRNSASTTGYYSPNHPSVRAGFAIGTRVRVLAECAAASVTERAIWTGRIVSISPLPGRYGPLRTLCTAEDCIGDLAEAEISGIGQQIDQTEVQLLQALIAAIDASAQPPATSYDAAEFTYPVAFEDIGGGSFALAMAYDLILSTRGGLLYAAADNTLTYKNHLSRFTELSQFTFDESHTIRLIVPSDRRNVYNHVTGTDHEKTITAAVQVLCTHTGTLALAPGESVVLTLNYTDPDRPELRIGGTAFVDPLVAGTDYNFTDDEAGLGANLNASMAIVDDFFSSNVTLSITNNHATSTAYKQLLQARGKGIYDESPITYTAESTQDYGQRSLNFDYPYTPEDSETQAHIDFIEASYRLLENQVDELGFDANRTAALMEQALTREIGDAVSLSESVALPDEVSAYIQWIGFEIIAGKYVRCTFGLAPRVVEEETHEDVLYCHDSFTFVEAAPETRIGFATIGFSEID